MHRQKLIVHGMELFGELVRETGSLGAALELLGQRRPQHTGQQHETTHPNDKLRCAERKRLISSPSPRSPALLLLNILLHLLTPPRRPRKLAVAATLGLSRPIARRHAAQLYTRYFGVAENLE